MDGSALMVIGVSAWYPDRVKTSWTAWGLFTWLWVSLLWDPMGEDIRDSMMTIYMAVVLIAMRPDGWGHHGQHEVYLHGCGSHCSETRWVRTRGTAWGLLTWLWVSLLWDPTGEDIMDSMTSSVAAEFSRRSSSSASTKLLINITASSSTAQTRNNGVKSKLSFSHKVKLHFGLYWPQRWPIWTVGRQLFRWWARSDLRGPNLMWFQEKMAIMVHSHYLTPIQDRFRYL